MKRLLIWRQLDPGIDIFEKIKPQKIYEVVQEQLNGDCPNWGNKLWFQGLYSEIDNGENEICIRTNETIEEINNSFDLIIYPMANIFCEEYASAMVELSETFMQVRIPVYVVACGVQANSYNELENLVSKIGNSSSRFIESIYHTGGEFALRGHFTKAFFERLGFSSAVVTGCPSMYQMGPSFKISSPTYIDSDLKIKPIINGHPLRSFEKIMKNFTESVFIDQHYFFDCLFNSNFFEKRSIKSDIFYTYKYDCYSAELLGQGRIKMFADMNDWYQYIKNSGFNYSFGSRIHGNIMSILAGVPATVIAKDARTLEMAQFFDIPHIIHEEGKIYSIDDLYEAYENADYRKFNQTYLDKYLFYQEFLKKHGIITTINTNNIFFSQDNERVVDEFTYNQEKFCRFAVRLKLEKPLLNLGETLLNQRMKRSE